MGIDTHDDQHPADPTRGNHADPRGVHPNDAYAAALEEINARVGRLASWLERFYTLFSDRSEALTRIDAAMTKVEEGEAARDHRLDEVVVAIGESVTEIASQLSQLRDTAPGDTPTVTTVDEIASEVVARVEQLLTVATNGTGPTSDDLQAIRTELGDRLDALAATIQAATGGPSSDDISTAVADQIRATSLAPLTTGMTELVERVDTLLQRVDQPQTDPAITSKLDAIAAQVAAAPTSENLAELAGAFSAAVTAIDARLDDLGSLAGGTADENITEIVDHVVDVRSRLDEVAARLRGGLRELSGQVQSVGTRVTDETVDRLVGEISTVSRRVDDLTEAVGEAITGLYDRLDRGLAERDDAVESSRNLGERLDDRADALRDQLASIAGQVSNLAETVERIDSSTSSTTEPDASEATAVRERLDRIVAAVEDKTVARQVNEFVIAVGDSLSGIMARLDGVTSSDEQQQVLAAVNDLKALIEDEGRNADAVAAVNAFAQVVDRLQTRIDGIAADTAAAVAAPIREAVERLNAAVEAQARATSELSDSSPSMEEALAALNDLRARVDGLREATLTALARQQDDRDGGDGLVLSAMAEQVDRVAEVVAVLPRAAAAPEALVTVQERIDLLAGVVAELTELLTSNDDPTPVDLTAELDSFTQRTREVFDTLLRDVSDGIHGRFDQLPTVTNFEALHRRLDQTPTSSQFTELREELQQVATAEQLQAIAEAVAAGLGQVATADQVEAVKGMVASLTAQTANDDPTPESTSTVDADKVAEELAEMRTSIDVLPAEFAIRVEAAVATRDERALTEISNHLATLTDAVQQTAEHQPDPVDITPITQQLVDARSAVDALAVEVRAALNERRTISDMEEAVADGLRSMVTMGGVITDHLNRLDRRITEAADDQPAWVTDLQAAVQATDRPAWVDEVLHTVRTIRPDWVDALPRPADPDHRPGWVNELLSQLKNDTAPRWVTELTAALTGEEAPDWAKTLVASERPTWVDDLERHLTATTPAAFNERPAWVDELLARLANTEEVVGAFTKQVLTALTDHKQALHELRAAHDQRLDEHASTLAALERAVSTGDADSILGGHLAAAVDAVQQAVTTHTAAVDLSSVTDRLAALSDDVTAIRHRVGPDGLVAEANQEARTVLGELATNIANLLEVTHSSNGTSSTNSASPELAGLDKRLTLTESRIADAVGEITDSVARYGEKVALSVREAAESLAILSEQTTEVRALREGLDVVVDDLTRVSAALDGAAGKKEADTIRDELAGVTRTVSGLSRVVGGLDQTLVEIRTELAAGGMPGSGTIDTSELTYQINGIRTQVEAGLNGVRDQLDTLLAQAVEVAAPNVEAPGPEAEPEESAARETPEELARPTRRRRGALRAKN